MNKNLEALLKWSTENSNPSSSSGSSSTAVTASNVTPNSSGIAAPAAESSSAGAPGNHKKLDPGVLDAILGKSDAQRMMEAVRDLKSEGLYTDEQKMDIWDELELLVEHLDNANDLANMKLWQPIYDFLSHDNEDFRIQACWVLGTAIQNNPRSQKAFQALDPLPKLLSLLSEQNTQLRSKAMYTLSGLLRHNPIACARFTELAGWQVLNQSLSDPSIQLRRKVVFLINSLFMNSVPPSAEDTYGKKPEQGPSEEGIEAAGDLDKQGKEAVRSYFLAAQRAGVVDTILRSLDSQQAVPAGPDGELEEIDEDYADKAVITLVTMVTKVRDASEAGTGMEAFEESQRDSLRELVKKVERDNSFPADLAKSEWEAFKTAVAN